MQVDTADLVRRAENAAQRELPGVQLYELEPLPGGASSLTYAAKTRSMTPTSKHEHLASVVVKVAPAGLPPVRNRDVLRQARVLRALHGVEGVLVPTVYGTEPGDPPEIPPLFVMEYIAGDSYEPHHTDTSTPPSDAHVIARATQAATMLARMHSVRPDEVGLGDEPVASPSDEIEKWRRAADSCSLTGALSEIEEAVYRELRDGLPAPLPPAVLHGDWRLGNMLSADSRVLGVIDWEIWSVGDPRLDLAWMQLMADPEHPTAVHPERVTLDEEALAATYAATAGFAPARLDWFAALVRYKQAAATMLLVKNAAKRGESGLEWRRREAAIPVLLEASLARLRSQN